MAKIFQRFDNDQEVEEAWMKEGVLMSVCWARISWLLMEDIPGESRLDFLRRAAKRGILTGKGHKELAKLEKAAAK